MFNFVVNKNFIKMSETKAYAAQEATTPLAPFSIDRRDPKPHDVQIISSIVVFAIVICIP